MVTSASSKDWITDEIGEAGGKSAVWLAEPGDAAQEQQIATAMRAARAAEYQQVTARSAVQALADGTTVAAEHGAWR